MDNIQNQDGSILASANEPPDGEAPNPSELMSRLLEKMGDISGVMEIFGTSSATSLQRAYPESMFMAKIKAMRIPKAT
jgi:hypothetical protein